MLDADDFFGGKGTAIERLFEGFVDDGLDSWSHIIMLWRDERVEGLVRCCNHHGAFGAFRPLSHYSESTCRKNA